MADEATTAFMLPDPLPETVGELDALLARAQAAFDEVYPGEDADTVPTQEQLDAMQAIADAITQIEAKADEVRQAEADRITVAQELASRVRGANTEDDADAEGDDEVEFTTDTTAEAAVEEPAEEPQPDAEKLTASAAKRTRSFAGVGKASGRRTADKLPQRRTVEGYTMDPGVPAYQTGPVDSLAIAETIVKLNTGARMRGTANAAGAYTLATLSREIPESLLASNDQHVADIIERITDETRLEGNSLTAAGGWCSPSEVLYDFLDTTPAGDLVDLPEFGIARGGVRFPEEPVFADIYSAFQGFDYTEAQLIAGETDPDFQKPCVEIPCGDMEEVRMDAVGLCIGNGILSAKAWPERTKKYVDEIMKAHLHRISARTINKIVAGSTAVSVPSTNLIGASGAILNVLEMAAVDVRTRHRLPSTTTIEGEAPTWLKPLIRADLAYRDGIEEMAVTDAMIEQWFTLRGIRLQFIVDWQTSAAGLPGDVTAMTAWPATVKITLYPAGTWFRAVEPVISLSALYDKAQLQKNKFTELFTEDGMAVFKRFPESRVYTIPVTANGQSGLRVPLGGAPVTP